MGAPSGQVHYPGTYAAGVYNRLFDDVSGVTIDNESLVNLPNWLPLTFRIDGGDWFHIDHATVLSYRQSFDLRSAVLTRNCASVTRLAERVRWPNNNSSPCTCRMSRR